MKKVIREWKELDGLKNADYRISVKPPIIVITADQYTDDSYSSVEIDYQMTGSDKTLAILKLYGFDILFQEPLSEDERIELRYVKAIGYEYIAKDKADTIYAYKREPSKHSSENLKEWQNGGEYFNLELSDYKMLSWDDEQPTLINDLLGVAE